MPPKERKPVWYNDQCVGLERLDFEFPLNGEAHLLNLRQKEGRIKM